MAVPFGFSAGDFIAALKVVKDVIDALRDSGVAGAEYRELIDELYLLETALLEVKRVELDDEQHAQRVALQQAASQCHRTIDEFWKKIQKYQPHLRSEGSGSKLKDGWRKVQWALCRKEDVAMFRAKLRGETGSINVLLMTVHMKSTAIERRRNDNMRRTLGAKLQQNNLAYLDMLKDIAKGVNESVQQRQELLLSTANVLQTNVQIYQRALSIQDSISSIPCQVERQQPVTFIDACGKIYPFHLEFINSAEAFRAVLRVRFKDIGRAKFDRGEYVIKETATNRDIDLSRPWDQCFLPGQKADMSMVFYTAVQGDTCPGCQTYCGDAWRAEVVCPNCGMTVRRITNVEEKEKDHTGEDATKDMSRAGVPMAARKHFASNNIIELRRAYSCLIEQSREEGEFTDLVLSHAAGNFKVHRIIVCPQSRVLYKACSGGFEEAFTGVIEMAEMLILELKRMVSFFYTMNYDDDMPDEETEQKTGPCISQLQLHARMFAIGDRYDIPGLRYLAVKKYSTRCGVSWDPLEFLESIPNGRAPAAVPELRNAAGFLTRKHLPKMLDDKADTAAYETVLVDVPEFTKDMLDIYMKGPLRGDCSTCGSNQALEALRVRCKGCGKGKSGC